MSEQPREPADVIVARGKLYTLNAKQPWAEAVAIRNGKIIAVGSNIDVEAYRGSRTQVIDAAGRMVLPGLVDTHCHLSMELHREFYCEFRAQTVAQVRQALRARLSAKPHDPVILGWALLTGEASRIGRRELDDLVGDRPVLIFDGHHVFANSKALEAAGITRDTPDPDGGEICRDAATGEPTGILREGAGRMALSRLTPKADRQHAAETYRKVFREANEFGLVRLHSAGFDIRRIGIFDELRRQGELTMRMLVATVASPPRLTPEQIESMEQARRLNHDDWIDAGLVKFFQDGLVEMHTGAMIEPYQDGVGVRGELLWGRREFTEAVVEMNRRGFIVLAHAVGDRSVREILDAYGVARRTNLNASILRIEHAEHVSHDDFSRFAALGVIASIHPLFAEAVWNEQEACVGPQKMRLAFPWHSVVSGGGRLAFGSDFPAYTLNPWEAMQALVTRGPMPQERITPAQAIEGYTLGAALAGGRQKNEGSLEVGKFADLIIVSQNIFEIEPREIGKITVLLTMVGGRIVHQV